MRAHQDNAAPVRQRAAVATGAGRETTVVVADDDRQVALALAGLLDQEPGFRVLRTVASGDAAVAAAAEERAALVLTDVRMPGGGPEVVRRLVALPHRPVVAAFSAQTDTATWTAMVAAGASAYLVKGAVGDDLPALLRRCVQGHLVVGVPGAAEVVRGLLAR